jgi:hypothetical protein
MRSLIGESVLEALPKLYGGLTDIVSFEFLVPRPVPLLQDRITPTVEVSKILQDAMQLRATSSLPFWDSVNLSCFGTGRYALPLLRQATFHNGEGSRRIQVDFSNFGPKIIAELIAKLAEGEILAISSTVQMKDNFAMRLPMLDFHCPYSSQNLVMIEEVIRCLAIGPGLILRSDKSFHFYGSVLICKHDFHLMLARSLLFAPIIDRAWIAHQLIEGSAALRVSPRQGKHPFVVSCV